jgi:hypothetical protein
MDANRFDNLSRLLSGSSPRRRALRATLGAILGGALARSLAGDIAAARHKRTHRRGEGDTNDGEVTTADHDCRHALTTCTGDGQCCTGTCLKSGICSCDAQNPCPRAKNPCKKAVCSSGRCLYENRALGRTCRDDGNPCTRDICDGQGNCIHPKLPNGTSCGANQVCFNRVCCTQGDPTCCPTCNGACCLRTDDICTPNDLQCCPPKQVCHKSCCAEGERCSDELVCCASGKSCEGRCCRRADDICTPGDLACCRPENVCGRSCCNPLNEMCENGNCKPIVGPIGS